MGTKVVIVETKAPSDSSESHQRAVKNAVATELSKKAGKVSSATSSAILVSNQMVLRMTTLVFAYDE